MVVSSAIIVTNFFLYLSIEGLCATFGGEITVHTIYYVIYESSQTVGYATKILGFEAGNIGSHSCCKGVAKIVAAGCTLSPTIVAIFIRVGWFLGRVKDKYLFR